MSGYSQGYSNGRSSGAELWWRHTIDAADAATVSEGERYRDSDSRPTACVPRSASEGEPKSDETE